MFSGVSAASVRNMLFWETPWWSHSAELQWQLRDAVKRAAQGEFIRMEVTHFAANGELRWVDFSLKPVTDETGKVIFLIPEGRDVTERKRAEEALKDERWMLRTMLDMHERDRKLVAYEIHDGLAQQLAGAVYKFQSIEHLRDRDPDAAQELFDEALRLLRDAMAETRRLIGGLRPPVLDESGVVDAVDCLISEQRQRGGPEIEFVHVSECGRLATPLESAIFRIVQEGLTNACRYSQSEKVRISIERVEDRVHVEVRDWGIGFDPAPSNTAISASRGFASGHDCWAAPSRSRPFWAGELESWWISLCCLRSKTARQNPPNDVPRRSRSLAPHRRGTEEIAGENLTILLCFLAAISSVPLPAATLQSSCRLTAANAAL